MLPFSIQILNLFSVVHHWWLFLAMPLMSCGFLCCLIRLKLNRSECKIRRCMCCTSAPHTIATNLCQQVVNWPWSMANGLIQTNFELKFISWMWKSKDIIYALQMFHFIKAHQWSPCMRSQLRDFVFFTHRIRTPTPIFPFFRFFSVSLAFFSLVLFVFQTE